MSTNLFFYLVLQMSANGASCQELQIAPKNRFRTHFFLDKIMDLSLLIFTLETYRFCMKCIEFTTRTYNFKNLTPAMAATEMAPIRSPGLISRAKAGVPISGTDCEGRCWNSGGAPSSHTYEGGTKKIEPCTVETTIQAICSRLQNGGIGRDS
jgi:hypothetical protein